MRKIRYVEIGGINATVRKDGEVYVAPDEQQGAPWLSLPAGSVDSDCVVVRRDWRQLAEPEQLRSRVLGALDTIEGNQKSKQLHEIELEPQGPTFG